jgi:hypothetical protein
MAAREGDQVFIRALDRAEAVAQSRYRAFFEWDDLRHATQLSATGLTIGYFQAEISQSSDRLLPNP